MYFIPPILSGINPIFITALYKHEHLTKKQTKCIWSHVRRNAPFSHEPVAAKHTHTNTIKYTKYTKVIIPVSNTDLSYVHIMMVKNLLFT